MYQYNFSQVIPALACLKGSIALTLGFDIVHNYEPSSPSPLNAFSGRKDMVYLQLGTIPMRCCRIVRQDNPNWPTEQLFILSDFDMGNSLAFNVTR